MTRLESAIRDNSTMRKFVMNPHRYHLTIPPIVTEAMLKGGAHNRGIEEMKISVPDTAEFRELVEKVEEVNEKLRLEVMYQVRASLCCLCSL